MKRVARGFDRTIGELVGKLPPWLHDGMAILSIVVSPVSWAAVMLVGFLLAQYLDNSYLATLSIFALLAWPLAELIKIMVRRPRPISLYVDNMRMRSYSFPSGHAYAAGLGASYTNVYLMQYLSGPWLWVVCIIVTVLALSAALSRVYLKAHFPSDVLAGLLLGVSVAAALLGLAI